MAPTLISRLAEWIADLRYEDLPPQVVELFRFGFAKDGRS